MRLGPPELLLILTIVILLFGIGRVSRIGSELGSAVSNFRRAMNKDNTLETGESESAS